MGLREQLHDCSRWLHRNVAFPAIITARGERDLYPFLRELREAQHAPTSELRSRQARRLAEILSYAHGRVPHYRRRWGPPWNGDGGPDPEEAFAALRKLPLLTKSDLQEHAAELQARPRPGRVTRKTTSGSTGQPVTVVKDRAGLARERAASWLGYGWMGIRMGDRGARFWGSPASEGTLQRRLRFAAADVAKHRIRCSAFGFDEEDLEGYWERCRRFRPDYLYGYVSMLEAFADHLRERGHDGSELGLKAVVTTAEVLTSPQRRLLSEVLAAPVQDEYGCGEVGPIAYECEEGSLHVMSETVAVELLAPDGSPVDPGETGEIVVTDLHNRAMPLIRYRIGDRAVRGDGCACGRGFPVLESVQGRAYEFVEDLEGRRYHGEFFMYLFEDLREEGLEIDRFRVTQESETRTKIEVEAARPLSSDARSLIRRYVARGTSGLEAEVEHVDEIEPQASGKRRLVRNAWLANGGSGRTERPGRERIA